MSPRSFVLGFLALSSSLVVGCSSGDPSHVTPPPPDSGAHVTQQGHVIDFVTKAPVAGATVKAGDQTVTTASDGAYSFSMAPGVPFSMSITGANRATTVFQERALLADVDDGAVNSVDEPSAKLLRSALPGYDESLGSISAFVISQGKCPTSDGATIAVSPAGAAKIVYFENGLPSATRTTVSQNELPSAVIYNVQPGADVTLSVTKDSCEQQAYPLQVGNIEYTGGIPVQAGDATTYAGLYLK
jgi:hypothetical protein